MLSVTINLELKEESENLSGIEAHKFSCKYNDNEFYVAVSFLSFSANNEGKICPQYCLCSNSGDNAIVLASEYSIIINKVYEMLRNMIYRENNCWYI